MSNILNRIARALGVAARAQNLTDDVKPLWRHGRAWFRRAGDRPGLELRVEWSHLMRQSLRIMLDVDPDEREITLSWAIPGMSHFVTLGRLPAEMFNALPMRAFRRDQTYPNERSIGIRFFDGAIWWSLWSDAMEWRSGDPKWMSGSWHPVDAILGSAEHRTRAIETRVVSIPMPEGAYEARIRMEVETWARPRWARWPLFTELKRAHVDIPGGIPIPGKGENSYDIGDDAVYGMTVEASSVEDAIGKVVANVLNSRQRRGGSHTFTPLETPPAADPVPSEPADVAAGS